MTKQVIRDRVGHKIGEIEDHEREQIARDAVGHKLGVYEKRSDITRDAQGRRIGTGNQLALLIGQSVK